MAASACSGSSALANETLDHDTAKRTARIPKASFTGFRLAYSTAGDVSHLSTTVFLGKIPDIWIGGPKTGLVFGTASRIRKYFSLKFNSAQYTVRESVRWFLPQSDSIVKEQMHVNDGDFNLFYRRNQSMELKIKTAYYDNGESTEASDTSTNTSTDTSDDMDAFHGEFVLNRNFHTEESHSLRSTAKSLESFAPTDSRNNRLNQSNSRVSRNSVSRNSVSETNVSTISSASSFQTARSSIALSEVMVYPPITISPPEHESPTLTPSPTPSQSLPSRSILAPPSLRVPSILNSAPKRGPSIAPTTISNGNVKFDMASLHSNQSHMTFAHPKPAQTHVQGFLDKEFVTAEKEHVQMLKKLQGFATRSKGRTDSRDSCFKLKVMNTILAGYEAGEAIRVDRMLVLTQRTSSKCIDAPNEIKTSPGNLHVVEAWREYNVVLRKNKKLGLEIQLFDEAGGHDFQRKPEHSIELNTNVKCGFYSSSDKTISMTKSVDDGTMIYILNARHYSIALTWLFIIKEVIRDELVRVIDVKLANMDVTLKLVVPEEMLRASMRPSKELVLVERDKGYVVEYGEILQYLRRQIIDSLQHASHRHKELEKWLAENPVPWFCFRIYDRIEWAGTNSRLFFIQSQLKPPLARLEFRQLTKAPMTSKTSTGKTLKRPHPVEGFLARITNISGQLHSNFRPFYRIQYFYTCENILFFSQMFKGTPPSPGNLFMKGECNRETAMNMIPQVYFRIPFPVDSNNHIPWLQTPDFEKYDTEAVEEFERRVQQIVKADAMIDLCSVKAVNALPIDSINPHHRYIQSFLWYSSPHPIEDVEIMDCAFEIVLFNGSHLKLMAPSKVIRDEWVQRLNDLVEFWKSLSAENLKSHISIRKINRNQMGISEFVDSNVTGQAGGLQLKLAVANDHSFTISSIAMSTCVVISDYIYLKPKKHTNFNQHYVVLVPGYLIIFTLFKRSKVSGAWRKTPYFKHYVTLPMSECYIYAGETTRQDLVESYDFSGPGKNDIPRCYSDGWKSSEEDIQRCFTLWFSHKQELEHTVKVKTDPRHHLGNNTTDNAGSSSIIRKLYRSEKRIVFLARSRQEREEWVYKISMEMNRFCRG